MNTLLLGANGQLGRSFLQHSGLETFGRVIPASRDGKLFDGSDIEKIDLSSPDTVSSALDRLRPDLIINAAAYTAVDRAEQEPSLAMRVNGEAVGVLANWAAANNALLVHYSTDYVFDGRANAPYATDAQTAPLGVYGQSKLAGENIIAESNAAHLLIRTAWVYAPHGQNFLRTMLRLGAERDELRVVADQFGAPTSTDLIVRATLAALYEWQRANTTQRKVMQGIHHLVASGHTSWHGFATAIFENALAKGLIRHSPRIVPITTAEFPTPAKRPAWSVLDNSGFQQRFGYALPDWQDGLNDVIETLSRQAR